MFIRRNQVDTSTDVTASFVQILQSLRPVAQEKNRKSERHQVEAGASVTEEQVEPIPSTPTGIKRKRSKKPTKRPAPIQQRRASQRIQPQVDYLEID